ncbi:DUF962 domain-containing protein [Kangiella sp. HZ709]|uniref:DUF962 domain-containing protein n=1 Tax=Kangiella sp. HZ709 TaxID=2666328 RepID=UPI0012AFB34C|nr:DUF962 domain-containing protein [Kangiella sp. HZ709]MRX28207.1 DUF962 domain-containing protein [Kangiella sp. HZ709]
MSDERFTSFKEFWPYYLSEHRLPSNRLLHYIGTYLSLSLLLIAISTQQWWLILAASLTGYGFAWVGHFFIEKNRPATFSYPLWSFLADYKMCYLALTGKLKQEWPKYF